MASLTPSYGAIPGEDDNPADEFDQSNLLFVKERPMDQKTKIRKALTTGLPLLVAILIMGAFALWISHAVQPPAVQDKTSPYHNDGDTTDTSHYLSKPPSSSETLTTSRSSQSTSSSTTKPVSGGKESCKEHNACDKLGLIGDCCPTAQGVMLGCCS